MDDLGSLVSPCFGDWMAEYGMRVGGKARKKGCLDRMLVRVTLMTSFERGVGSNGNNGEPSS
jgi:phenylalanine-4-hydroxylase